MRSRRDKAPEEREVLRLARWQAAWIWLVVVACVVATVVLLCKLLGAEQTFAKTYKETLRGPLFTGFLTLGGFLLSIFTSVVLKLKEAVFDQSWYEERVKEAGQLDRPGVYGPLRRLSSFLLSSIVTCLSASAVQMTVGLSSRFEAAAFGLAVGAGALALVLRSLWLVRNNLSKWFEELEKKKKKERQEAAQAALEKQQAS